MCPYLLVLDTDFQLKFPWNAWIPTTFQVDTLSKSVNLLSKDASFKFQGHGPFLVCTGLENKHVLHGFIFSKYVLLMVFIFTNQKSKIAFILFLSRNLYAT